MFGPQIMTETAGHFSQSPLNIQKHLFAQF